MTRGRRSRTEALHDTTGQTTVQFEAIQVMETDRCEISHEAMTVMTYSQMHICIANWQSSVLFNSAGFTNQKKKTLKKSNMWTTFYSI